MKFTQKSRFKYAVHIFISLSRKHTPGQAVSSLWAPVSWSIKQEGWTAWQQQLSNHKRGSLRKYFQHTECESDISGSSLFHQPNHPCSEKPHPNAPQPLQFQVRMSWRPLPLQPSVAPPPPRTYHLSNRKKAMEVMFWRQGHIMVKSPKFRFRYECQSSWAIY